MAKIKSESSEDQTETALTRLDPNRKPSIPLTFKASTVKLFRTRLFRCIREQRSVAQRIDTRCYHYLINLTRALLRALKHEHDGSTLVFHPEFGKLFLRFCDGRDILRRYYGLQFPTDLLETITERERPNLNPHEVLWNFLSNPLRAEWLRLKPAPRLHGRLLLMNDLYRQSYQRMTFQRTPRTQSPSGHMDEASNDQVEGDDDDDEEEEELADEEEELVDVFDTEPRRRLRRAFSSFVYFDPSAMAFPSTPSREHKSFPRLSNVRPPLPKGGFRIDWPETSDCFLGYSHRRDFVENKVYSVLLEDHLHHFPKFEPSPNTYAYGIPLNGKSHPLSLPLHELIEPVEAAVSLWKASPLQQILPFPLPLQMPIAMPPPPSR